MTLRGLQEQDLSVIGSLTQHIISLTRKMLRLRSDFVCSVHDDTPDKPGYLSNAGVPVKASIALPHSDDWSNGHLAVTDIDPVTGLSTTSIRGNPPLDEDTSIYDLYADRAEHMGDEPLYTYKSSNDWVTVTTNEFLADVHAVAKGLIRYGLKKGDAVTFTCRTSYNWDLTDAAIIVCDDALATVYDINSVEQIRSIVNNSDVRLLIVQDTDIREKAGGSVEEHPSLEYIIIIKIGGLDEIKAYGAGISDEELGERISPVKETDLCSIVYTSGSTVAPKGVETTHEHYCQTALDLPTYMPELLHDKKNIILSFLPQVRSFVRIINHIIVASNVHIYIAASVRALTSNLQMARPSIMIMVPCVLEKVYNAASQKAGRGPKGAMFASTVVAVQSYMKGVSINGKADALARTRHAAFDLIVCSSLCEVLGSCAKRIVADDTPLDPELLAFFRGAGVPTHEGYGLTETTAPCAFSPPGTSFHAGSVGIAFPGFSLRIAEDGEIQVKDRAAFPRYHKGDETTELSFTEDGWYVTGDLGHIDNDGFLYITGRKKDLIITTGGKNVSPGPIEEVIQRYEFASRMPVLGDKHPFISALVTLDEKSLHSWLVAKGPDESMPLEGAVKGAVVRVEVQKWVDQANEGVPHIESVRKFITPPEEFTQESGLMTVSMKVIRLKVIKRYSILLNTQIYTKRKQTI